MNGTIITAEEVKARWAYGEIQSERFGHTYKDNLEPSLYDTAKAGRSFSDVQKDKWPLLIKALERARDDEGFINNVDTCGAPHYICVEWQVSDLINCRTLPSFKRIPYWSFLAHHPKRDEAGNPDNADPRYKSHQIPFDPNFRPLEPLIAIDPGDGTMLLEGYLRSILWLRNPTHPLLVWMPKR